MAAIVVQAFRCENAINYTMARKPSGAAKGKKYFGTGRYNMPGGKMTKAGKRRRMQMDINRASPRRGKRR